MMWCAPDAAVLNALKTLKLRSRRALGFFAALLALVTFGLPHTALPNRLNDVFAALPLERRAEPVSKNLTEGVRSGRVMVALAFGQSNAANSGETRYSSRENVYNVYRGKLYRARDPLLGATGRGGSVWTRLGDRLIAAGHYDAVVIIPLAVGNTAIASWTVGGELHAGVLKAVREVQAQGLSVTHLLWHQGESDPNTPADAYQSMFKAMLASIRSEGVDAPIYVSVATRCHQQGPNETLRRAQQSLVDPAQNIYAGPDTDTLGRRYRYDGCHFSTEGLERFAELWLSALEPE